jgi:probable F420-dependent oxidoreductase
MRFFLEYPLHIDADGGAWLDPAHMVRYAQAAEAAGVDAIALTEHPAPSRAWRDAGGHDTIDPFAGLSYFAAVTTRLRVMTYLTVVPYHNPFVLAKAMTSLDILSGGRAHFVLGTGYMQSEFVALGADFERRNELFDEAMSVVRGLFRSPHKFQHEGKNFQALDVTLSPTPIQKPFPPMWLGGNSRIVRRRVAEWADGWAPLTIGGAALGKLAHTAPILSDDQFAQQIVQLKKDAADLGRDPDAIDIAAIGTARPGPDASLAERVDHLHGLAEIGVTWTSIPIDSSSASKALDDLADYGENVIAAMR